MIPVWLVLFAAQVREPPAIRVTTRMVQVNVLALDRKGQPIEGLGKDDFELLDKGVKQQIVSVDMAAASRRDLPKPLPPGTFTNDWEHSAAAQSPSATVLLFDALNTSLADQAYARNQLSSFLDKIKPGEDRIAVYALGRTLRILHEFNDSPANLKVLLKRLKGEQPVLLDDATPNERGEALDNFLEELDMRMRNLQTRIRTQSTLEVLEIIGRHLALMPGRKNLVWISSSFPMFIGFGDDPFSESGDANTGDQMSFTEEMDRTIRFLNNSNVAIYPVDPRGLAVDPAYSAANAKSGMAKGKKQNPMRRIQETHDTMQVMAQRTGGLASYNSNDIEGAIERAVRESRVSYLITYYPAHDQWNAKWRDLKVRVSRPGTQVRHRTGYVALADPNPTPKAADKALQEVLNSPVDATGLQLDAALASIGQPPSQLAVNLTIAPGKVILRPEGERMIGAFETFYIVRGSEKGTKPELTYRKFSISFTPAQMDAVRKQGIRVSRTFAWKTGLERMKIVVRDSNGSIGSLNIRLANIPNTPRP